MRTAKPASAVTSAGRSLGRSQDLPFLRAGTVLKSERRILSRFCRVCWAGAFVTTIVLLGLLQGTSAEEKSVPKTSPPVAKQPKVTSPAQPSQSEVVMPEPAKIVLLLRSTMMTLNDALQTGNFTVLHDIGAPSFREANSAARLSHQFTDLASRGVDLSATSIITPQITEAPTLDKGMLHVKGYFPGQPIEIDFEVLYQAIGGHWRLFGLSVQPVSRLGQPAGSKSGPDDEK